MTYLLPDDWFANHGLAPGDARGPQPILQPRPGNIVTSPIMRGYYGRPPIAMLKTRSVALRPFMDTDVMWGVNGLGEADINAILDKMKKEMKDLALKQAAASTAIAIGLNAIPVLGTAASVIYSAVQTVVGVQNQKEMQEVVADTNNQAKLIVADYQLKTEAAQNAVFDQEMVAGTTIAMACQGMQGLDGWISDQYHKITHALKPKTIIKVLTLAPIAPLVLAAPLLKKTGSIGEKIAAPIDRVENAVDKSLNVLSGEQAVIEAKKARTKVLAKVRADMEAQYQTALANMNSPEFRAELRKTIATKVISDPSVAQLVRSRCGLDQNAPLPGASVIASMPSGVKGGVFAAAGVTAAIVVFAVLGGGHH